MKKYYVRAGMHPLDNWDAYQIIMRDAIGGNSGNLLYAYSIFRALTTTETECCANYYRYENAEQINEEYDAFIIPLANAFRPRYRELPELTRFIKKLKIPCIVTGVGVQLPFEPDFLCSYDWDEQAKEFLSAVLEKSASIGVRGEITAKYLERLGFKAHTRIIGCPSMFLYGEDLNIRKPGNISYKSKIAFNSAKDCPPDIWHFIEKSQKYYFSDYYFLPQRMNDLRLLWGGKTHDGCGINYPVTNSHPLITENRMRFFINVPSWLDFMSQIDFNLGTNIHGTIAGILGGAPSVLIATDSRTRELAQYYQIPMIKGTDIDKYSNPFVMIENADFSQIEKGHKERFENYTKFLRENGLNTLFDSGEPSIFDERVKSVSFYPGIESIIHVNARERAERLDLYMNHLQRRIEKAEKLRKG